MIASWTGHEPHCSDADPTGPRASARDAVEAMYASGLAPAVLGAYGATSVARCPICGDTSTEVARHMRERHRRAATDGITLAQQDGALTPAGAAAYAAVAFARDAGRWGDYERACVLLGETLLVHSTPCLEAIARGANPPLLAAHELAEDMEDEAL